MEGASVRDAIEGLASAKLGMRAHAAVLSCGRSVGDRPVNGVSERSLWLQWDSPMLALVLRWCLCISSAFGPDIPPPFPPIRRLRSLNKTVFQNLKSDLREKENMESLH